MPANPVIYLDLDDLLALIRALGVGPVRDVGLLDAAASRPRSSAFGRDAYPTVTLKAAALLQSLVRNHALVDGNKRLAWLAVAVFLDLNGLAVEMTDDATFDLVMDAAQGKADLEEIADRLVVLAVPHASRRAGPRSTTGPHTTSR
ncbi:MULTISPECIES: type II toxin-antitoxin system death-on-curing family toxin [unclassified Pseudofrankia]|uniref:type II toxin-antitoxin system death-on-curing family toxin n=1 Tax=unclassified Pseudofrankia TaxID=2994372 RepID=UPI0008DA8E4A|nr:MULTISPECIES: type II toxin-antitoxin system death-on-curing family toxin [unclassified Pseudofrankia]MDT3441058.1 type II toxin-antitoxin system death-on-curing family toxin [Pseudofrankia sp. BMG5.37]OHV42560.1 alcohol dehydrogenase [Pseudofrankia sp. BMG5.36]